MKKKINKLTNDKKTIYLFGHGIVGTAYGTTCGLGCLMLFDLKPNIKRKVGDKFDEKDIKKDSHYTALFFSKQKDVDAMIKKLQNIKKEMKKDKPIKPKEIKLLCEKRYHKRPAKKSLTK